jgi:hypothetical protein
MKLVFRIRKRYFDQIVAGTKTVEYRRDIPFWRTRVFNIPFQKVSLQNDVSGLFSNFVPSVEVTAVFLCGKRSHRRQITHIDKIITPDYFSEQGKKDVNTPACFAFHLGAEVN